MKHVASLRRSSLSLALLSLAACSSGSAIIGVPDATNDLGGADASVTDGPSNDLAPPSDRPLADAPSSDAPPSDAPTTDAPPSDAPLVDVAPADVTPEPQRAWTIFVYGHADHNLSSSLEADINEMSQATFGSNINVIVMADFDARQPVQGEVGGLFTPEQAAARMTYPAGTTWYRVRSRMAPEVLRREPEKDLDRPEELSAAINAAFLQFPAERYGLVLWDHGGSWNGGYGGDIQDGTRELVQLPDGGVARPGPVAMPVAQTALAIQSALTARGLVSPRPLEFLTFDTCLMGTAEVIREFQPLSEVYMANAEIDYGDGWDYTATLSYIAANPTAPPADIARNEVMHWEAHHRAATMLDRLMRSHVAIEMSRVDPFMDAISDFSHAVTSADAAARARVARHGYFSVPGYAVQAATLARNEESAPEFRDLGQFLGRIAADTMIPDALRTAATTARTRLTEMILGASMGASRSTVQQLGVHVAFPPLARITSAYFDAYPTNVPTWHGESSWLSMLNSLTPSAAPPTIESTALNFDAPSAATPPTLRVTTTGDVAEAAVALLATSSASTLDVLEFLGRREVTAGTPANIVWDGRRSALSGIAPPTPAGDGGVDGGAGGPTLQPITVYTVLPSAESTPSTSAPQIVSIAGTCADRTGVAVCMVFCLDAGGRMVVPIAMAKDIRRPSVVGIPAGTAQTTLFIPRRLVVRFSSGDGGVVADPEDADGTAVWLNTGTFAVESIPAAAGTYFLQAQMNDVHGRSAEAPVHRITLSAPFAM